MLADVRLDFIVSCIGKNFFSFEHMKIPCDESSVIPFYLLMCSRFRERYIPYSISKDIKSLANMTLEDLKEASQSMEIFFVIVNMSAL